MVGYIFLDASPAPPIHTTTRHCALRDRWLAVGARAPWSCSLHQRVLLTMKTGSSSGSSGRFVAAAVRRWFPTPPRHHCVILWAVSTLITKAYFAASLATAWSVGSFGTGGLSSILVFLCRLVSFSGLVIVTRYFPSRVLMTLSLVIVTCFAKSFTLRSAAIARLVLDASNLHYTRAVRPTLFELCCTVFLLDAEFRRLLPSSVFLLNVASSSERLLFFLATLLSSECGLLFERSLVFLLNAAVFADLALYLALGGLCLGRVELSCPLTPILVLQARPAPFLRLPIVWSFSRSLAAFSLKLARDLQH